jgi:hypothetical protein
VKTTPDSVYDLAADFKSRGLSKYVAWDQFIIARGLKPEINAKDFYKIFASVSPKPLNDFQLPADYKPTHRDTLIDMDCQIDIDAAGVQHIVWADGHTGSNPPGFGLDRFLPLVGGAS